MFFFPAKDEFLIYPFSKEYVQGQLMHQLTLPENKKVFIGWLEGDKFKISKKLIRPDNFVPVIQGFIEASSKGVIIILKYRLMYSTKMFLLFWSLILLFLSLFFTFRYEVYLYGIISLGVGVLNYLIVYFNFRKQVHISHDLFINILNTNSAV